MAADWDQTRRDRVPANAAWLALATIAFNLTRAIGVAAGGTFTRAEDATVRARLINTPALMSGSARRQHLPTRWPWANLRGRAWTAITITATEPQPHRATTTTPVG